MSMAWIGAIGGSLIGVAGGLFGTYCSIRNTNGPRERAFMIKAAILWWIAISGFIAGLLMIPQPYHIALWLVYPFLLLWAIKCTNTVQSQIRAEEAGHTPRQ